MYVLHFHIITARDLVFNEIFLSLRYSLSFTGFRDRFRAKLFHNLQRQT
jgi:hypothetical protein